MVEQGNRNTVRKWFWVWEFEQEEQWLNAMAMEGWLLDGVGFCTYHFIPCTPGEYTVRMEMREPDEAYLAFLQNEMGAEYVGRMGNWIYFRRRNELGEFDLFSDIDSRIDHLDRIAKMLLVIGIANIVIGLANSLFISGLASINLLAACLLMYGLGRIRGKEEELKRERALHE